MLKDYLLNIKKEENRLGFMPFWIAGYPTINESIERIKILLKYADVLEIGIPFSDPIADGVIIQNANKIAIKNGFKTKDLFSIIKNANKEFQKPVVILCYFNIVLQYGIENFMQEAKESGVKAILIPDLPPIDESTCASRVVGMWIRFTPLKKVSEANPTRSPITPPPKAIIVRSLLSLFFIKNY